MGILKKSAINSQTLILALPSVGGTRTRTINSRSLIFSTFSILEFVLTETLIFRLDLLHKLGFEIDQTQAINFTTDIVSVSPITEPNAAYFCSALNGTG
jgi:hypothetical protein